MPLPQAWYDEHAFQTEVGIGPSRAERARAQEAKEIAYIESLYGLRRERDVEMEGVLGDLGLLPPSPPPPQRESVLLGGLRRAWALLKG